MSTCNSVFGLAEAFPGVPPPTDPNSSGQEVIDNKLQDVFYVLKEGARAHCYDISSYADTSINDTMKVAEVFSSDESDMDEAATKKMNAAADIVLGRSRNIRAVELEALRAVQNALSPGAPLQQKYEPSDSDGEAACLTIHNVGASCN